MSSPGTPAPSTPESSKGPARGLSRRALWTSGAVAGLGATAAVGADALVRADREPAQAPPAGEQRIPFHGEHQAGVGVTPQSHSTFIGLDLRPGADRARLRRLMRVLSDDAARLTRGTAALADMEPELAKMPSRLTVTFGFGRDFVRAAGGTVPSWLRPLPSFDVDRLVDAWSGGDLAIEVAADDPVTVAHAVRMLVKDGRTFTTVRWMQHGFRRARGTEKPGTTMRNLFGQIDGTVNPVPEDDDFNDLVWSTEGWLRGGTGWVIRRISMNLDDWDKLDRGGREEVVGRTLDTGAPLTGTREHDTPDFSARTQLGFPVIPEFAHVPRAITGKASQRIVRRGYNYDVPPSGDDVSDSGLIFTSFQKDVDAQFVPIQRRLDQLDLLNQWTTPVGSAVFAIPPGCQPGGYIGETLLEA